MLNTKCVYTAICGDFDTPKPVRKPNPEWDYILFTDNKNIKTVDGWTKIIYLDNDLPSRLKAKYPKILPHKYLPEQYKTSIWIDGAYEIIGDINILYGPYHESQISVPIHPSKRNNIYQEAEEILKYGLDIVDNIQPQLSRYKSENFEGRYRGQIYQCGIIIRDHYRPEIKILMERWMNEINKGSIRDQLSFPYVLFKYLSNGVRFSKMSQLQALPVLKWHTHQKKINNIYFISPYGFDLKIGDRLNYEISKMDEDAWIVITDQDTVFLTDKVGDHLNNTINRYPDTDLFSCYTNRLGLHYQRLPEVDPENYDMLYHHDIAQEKLEKYYSTSIDIDKPVAGFFMMFPKRIWKNYKFQSDIIEINKEIDGKRGVYFDYDFSWRILKDKGKIKLIKGLYVYHHYRVRRNIKDVTHLLKRV
jgi:hypothetical protein